ncbi:hypothetical protein JTS93_22360 [Clostridium botulinum]|nr:hypothetical protein [Clostridium botulinum]
MYRSYARFIKSIKNTLAPNATIQVTLDTGETQSFQVNQIVSIDDI